MSPVPSSIRALLALPFVLVLACTGSGPSVEGDGGPSRCTRDVDCSDGLFCNGVERCDPSDPAAGATGCIEASAGPCEATQTCSEEQGRCQTVCAVERDADGDGIVAVECGGIDCDDSDGERYPGNVEVCDAEGHDEDCDPTTIGTLDADADGAISAACCNGEKCGSDCDDANLDIHPGQAEICNGEDVDCDGLVDEGVQRLFFPDLDGDGYGDRAGEPLRLCALEAGWAENSLDCDDSRAEAAPGRSEVCDGEVDEDCDGTVDEMLAVSLDCQNRFGSPPRTAFACTTEGACQIGECGMYYGDCDDERSNGCETDMRSDTNHCGDCGRSCGAGGRCEAGVCDEVVDVEAGAGFTCARRERADGTPTGVVCWGANEFGQLGDGTTVDRLTPVPVPGLESATVLALSSYEDRSSSPFACALASGLVQCWGSNDRGQLGRGTVGSVGLTPQPVVGTPKVVAYYDEPFRGTHRGLAVGMQHACVLEDTGVPTSGGAPSSSPYELRCWGGNDNDTVVLSGDASYPQAETGLGSSRVPPPLFLTHASMLSSCMVLRTFGTEYEVFCQGWSGIVRESVTEAPSQLSSFRAGIVALVDGAIVSIDHTATYTLEDGPMPPVAQIEGSSGWDCVRLSDGTVACRTRVGSTFTRVPGIDDAIDLSTGPNHACVVRASGGVWCWGANGSGQCGTGDQMDVATPTRVVGL